MTNRSFLPSVRAGALAGLAIAGLCFSSLGAMAQVTGATQTTTDANGNQQPTVTISACPGKKEKVVPSKDTKKELRKEKKIEPVDAGLPDKVLYDKALDATKRGHFDVARLDLQTLLNTYPDSQYLMKAKLAVADSWYKEGGTAALTQAEQEYKDFITFFPNAPEAAEAQMRVGDAYEPEARYIRTMNLPEAGKAKLEKIYDDQAIAAYRKVVLEHSASAHVEDARDRLDAMNAPIPTPTPEQIAASLALEN